METKIGAIPQPQTFSLIVETENLGMAGLDDLFASLDSLNNQTFPVSQLQEVVIIAAGHVSIDTRELIKQRYPWARLHLADKALEYIEAKVLGAKIATTDAVIFADSDMRYQNTWLENIITTFAIEPTADVVAGETRVLINSYYTMSLNLMWMFPVVVGNLNNRPQSIPYFPLNNFAIKREIMFQASFFPELPLYRGRIGLWIKQLVKDGCQIYRAPGTRGYHAAPASLGDWWYRMLIYGHDFVAQADFMETSEGAIKERRSIVRRVSKLIGWSVRKVLGVFTRAYKLIKERPSYAWYLIWGIPLAMINVKVTILGGIITCINRDYLFKKITAREWAHIV